MFILNFTLLCFMLRISSLRKFSFSIRVMMVFMSSSIPQTFWSPCIFATVNLWHRCLCHPTPRILNFLVSSNKIICTSRRSLSQCQACALGKSSHLALRPTGHKTSAPLDLIFSYVWGPAPMFSSNGFRYFVIFVDVHTKHIWYYPLVAKSVVFHFSTFLNTCCASVFT